MTGMGYEQKGEDIPGFCGHHPQNYISQIIKWLQFCRHCLQNLKMIQRQEFYITPITICF